MIHSRFVAVVRFVLKVIDVCLVVDVVVASVVGFKVGLAVVIVVVVTGRTVG